MLTQNSALGEAGDRFRGVAEDAFEDFPVVAPEMERSLRLPGMGAGESQARTLHRGGGVDLVFDFDVVVPPL